MSRDPFDPKRELEKKEQAIQERIGLNNLKKLIAFLMATEKGREAMLRILDITEMNVDSFSTNALEMARNTGRASVGRAIVSLMDSEDYLTMMREEDARRKQG